MRAATVLRICVVLQWVLLALGIVGRFFLESSLPEPLRDWLAADAERSLTLPEVAFGVVMIPALFCGFAGSVGLLFLKRWAAWLYLVSLVAGYIMYPFLGPTVEHGLVDTIDELSVLLSGLVVGLAFFSDALSVR